MYIRSRVLLPERAAQVPISDSKSNSYANAIGLCAFLAIPLPLPSALCPSALCPLPFLAFLAY